jgi:hypothetical protein
VQDDQAKIAVGEEAAEASSSSLSLVPVMTDVDTVLGVLFAAEAAAVIAVGMSMQLDSPSVFRHNEISDISNCTQMQEASRKNSLVRKGTLQMTTGLPLRRAICSARENGRVGAEPAEHGMRYQLRLRVGPAVGPERPESSRSASPFCKRELPVLPHTCRSRYPPRSPQLGRKPRSSSVIGYNFR